MNKENPKQVKRQGGKPSNKPSNNMKGKSSNQKKRKSKKKLSFKLLTMFLLYELVFGVISAPFIIYYGPFENLKKTVVGTAMSTFTHQYIATWFLSKDQIDKILEKDNTVQASSSSIEDLNAVKVNHSTNSSKNELYSISTNKFNGYILEVKDSTKIKVAYTKYMNKAGQRTSEMAEDLGAIAAINGGSFKDMSSDGKQWAGTGASPAGLVMAGGKIVFKDVNTTTPLTVTAFTQDGILVVGNHTINELNKLHVTEALSFRPPTLIINGQGQIRGDGGEGLQPRTAIGQKKDGTVLFLVVDGRSGLKPGASLKDLEQILLQHGAWNASNLDGGSSSTLYYNGQVINTPSNWDGERSVATSICVMP